jgi:hypothetical protein
MRFICPAFEGSEGKVPPQEDCSDSVNYVAKSWK